MGQAARFERTDGSNTHRLPKMPGALDRIAVGQRTVGSVQVFLDNAVDFDECGLVFSSHNGPSPVQRCVYEQQAGLE